MRCEQWASALYAIVAERRALPFEWGAHDCVMWAADVTVALGCTGGHHRSVYLANRLGETLKPILKNVQIRHRDLS